MKSSRTHCALAAAASWLLFTLAGCSADSSAGKQKQAKQPVPVKTVSVTQQEIERTTTQPATVNAYYRAEVRAKVSGYVQKVQADIGDFVEAGTTLAVIDVPEMQKQRKVVKARITRSESEEQRAKSGIELAKANVQSAEASLVQAKAELKRTEAALAAAKAEFVRTRDLVRRQSLEDRVLDEVRKKRDSELANKDAVTSAIHSAEAQVAVAKAKLSFAKAELQAAEADTTIARGQLEELDVLIGYATLKAPFAGLVTRRSVDPGDLVREGSEVGKGEPLFVVSQVDKVRVHIPVPEVDAAHVSRGDAVRLSFPTFSGEPPMEGTVTRHSSDLDPSTRTMLVEAELPNPDRKLLPGMFGQASITLSTKVAANMLPARALRFEESGQAYVYVVTDDQTVAVVPVQIGLDNGHSIEIVSGLEPGQQVVDAHLKRFTTGQRVAPLKN